MDTRARIDAINIQQGLNKFPVLEQVMVGRQLEWEGEPVRQSWGARQIRIFKCPSRHCRKDAKWLSLQQLFKTVVP